MDSATAGTQTTTQPHIFAPAEWSRVAASTRKLAPEAFDSNGQVLNLIEGEWKEPGHPRPYHSANDGTLLGTLPMLDAAAARRAVEFAAREFSSWSKIDLNERKRRISECLAGLRENHELLTYLLMWEIGKPLDLAQSDVDRCISGVEWYVENVEAMLGRRKPLGLVSNIASWNYPLSVIVHGLPPARPTV